MELLWIDDECAGDTLGEWRAGLAPEVELTVLTPAAAQASAGDDRPGPYAVLGAGAAIPAAVALAGRLAATRPAACLVVAGSTPPVDSGPDCPVVAFLPAGDGGDELVGSWRQRAGGGLAVRRLASLEGFRSHPDRETILAVKEELRVWPS
jgi:hypothetical protein